MPVADNGDGGGQGRPMPMPNSVKHFGRAKLDLVRLPVMCRRLDYATKMRSQSPKCEKPPSSSDPNHWNCLDNRQRDPNPHPERPE